MPEMRGTARCTPGSLAWLRPIIAPPALAQDPYPDRAIHIVVPFPAGGPSDVLARIIGERMSADFGQASWSITGRAPIR